MDKSENKEERSLNDAEDLLPQETFSPKEEAELIKESNAEKREANELFVAGKYEPALGKYDQAVAVCPNYLDFEVAVLQSNIAACYIKLAEWKAAVKSATECVNRLAVVDKAIQAEQDAEDAENEVEEEIISEGAAKAGPARPREEDPAAIQREQRRDSVRRIRGKALLRRAKARTELGGWGDLTGAQEDYNTLVKMEGLTATDRTTAENQLRLLPARIKSAQEKEMGEMWGKLKDLGNGLLKPFGLSTDNFQMVQDPKTGGYSMNFQGNGNKS